MGIKLFIILVFASQLLFSQNKLESLVKSYNLESDEFILIGYFTMGSCVKCNITQFQFLEAAEKSKKKNKVNIVAAVQCDRELELNLFKKKDNWKHKMIVDDGNLKESLGADLDVLITFIANKGKTVIHVYPKNARQKLKEITKITEN